MDRRGSKINSYRFHKRAPKAQASRAGVSGACSSRKIFGFKVPKVPFPGFLSHSDRIFSLSKPLSRFQLLLLLLLLLLKIYIKNILIMKLIWPISVKRWKPVWIRADWVILYLLYIPLFAQMSSGFVVNQKQGHYFRHWPDIDCTSVWILMGYNYILKAFVIIKACW